ncbi:MAG: NUDIX domain-containing protein, partial [Planctomycetota bacterium]
TERELDHVFAGRFEGSPHPNPEEIDAFRWIDREELEREMATTPELFTPWFLIMMQQHADAIWQALR